ncbi:hypothetical protein Q4Q35_04995 [Flavivirga aquimarina]|uniref:Uncharacterized protein n=1 Tax=Flavivirga aquimarina TaxID=2027862 RepID=A0ABT8W7T4_9FLAO|nr:hypothetical protein [Flavivirga aquimarina]MDO5969158.1 hypothetical protein [Flavivirga aquimarina]
MTTKKPSYIFVKVICEKKDCNETYSVLISSEFTVVNRPVGGIEDLSKQKEVTKTNIIDDSIDIKCSCGHSQKVDLKRIT